MKGWMNLAPLLILVVIAVIMFFYQYAFIVDVNYAIQLDKTSVSRGQEVVLSYTITNGLPTIIDNVYLDYGVNSLYGGTAYSNSEYIGPMSAQQSIGGSVNIPTSPLGIGEHTIYTILHYTQDGMQKQKQLTLKVEVF